MHKLALSREPQLQKMIEVFDSVDSIQTSVAATTCLNPFWLKSEHPKLYLLGFLSYSHKMIAITYMSVLHLPMAALNVSCVQISISYFYQ